MRSVALLVVSLAACGSEPLTLELRPFVTSPHADRMSVRVDGLPFAGDAWTRTFPDRQEGRTQRIPVELVDGDRVIARAIVVPGELCAPFGIDPAEVGTQKMEVYLVDPADHRLFTDGPCIQCVRPDGTFAGGCGGGAWSEPVSP